MPLYSSEKHWPNEGNKSIKIQYLSNFPHWVIFSFESGSLYIPHIAKQNVWYIANVLVYVPKTKMRETVERKVISSF